MFAGIVEGLAEVVKIDYLKPGLRLHIKLGKFSKNLKHGSSVCISGCCLTATKIKNNIAVFDVMPETLNKTYFPELKAGNKVNVERSLRLGQEVGGHFVYGHIDCAGKIIKKVIMKDFSEMEIEFPKEFSHLLIDKGSIAVEGISLTVVKAESGKFTIALIPTTLKMTTLGIKKEGDVVNIEFDQMAKYVAKIMAKN